MPSATSANQRFKRSREAVEKVAGRIGTTGGPSQVLVCVVVATDLAAEATRLPAEDSPWRANRPYRLRHKGRCNFDQIRHPTRRTPNDIPWSAATSQHIPLSLSQHPPLPVILSKAKDLLCIQIPSPMQIIFPWRLTHLLLDKTAVELV